ncbi:MAG: iron ABC transporter permease [Actinomycetota bacterium]
MTTTQPTIGRPSPMGRGLRRVWGRVRGQGAFGASVVASVLIIVGFVLFPAAEIVARSLGADGRAEWERLFGASRTIGTIRNTIWLGVLVGIVGTIAGLIMALVQVRTRFRFKRTLHLIALIPVISPPFAVGMSVITLFGRSGLITKGLFDVRYDIFGLDGLLISLGVSFMPIAYLNFVGMLRAFDGSLEEAATDLGAGLIHRLRTVVLPLLAPGIASSFLLIFVSAIADLGNPVLLGGGYDVLSSRIYLAVIGEFNNDKAAVLAVMLLVPSLLVFSAQYFWLRKREYITVTGKPVGDPKPFEQRRVTWPLQLLAVLMAAFVVLIYGYILVGAFTEVWNINFSPTLDNMRFVLRGAGREAVYDTVLLALLATPISSLAGLVIAFVITQRDFRGKGLLDFASVLGVAIPGTIIGVGLLLAYNAPLLGGLIPKLSGTAAILVLAFTVRSLPGVVRVAVGALNQLSGSLEEASISLGATPAQTFRKVILPLIRPAMFSSLVWSFARSMTSLSPIIFLGTPQWRIMTARILNEADQGRFSNAAAYSVVLVSVVLAAISLLALTTGFRVNDEPTLPDRSMR